MNNLSKRLKEYTSSDMYPFHMPGHKRRAEVALASWLNEYDITEVAGFDDLHHPNCLLKDLMADAARIYGVKNTFYLVNGSTCGILASISAACKNEKHIICARNSHKSAYHAIELMGLSAEYLYPMATKIGIQGSISPDEVNKAIEKNPGAKVVYITSPTYDGVVSDIKAIAKIVHENDGILIVDEAHGAHFSFDDEHFPKSATKLGADIVIQSVHKTLPAPTQTALLHVCSDRVSKADIMHYLNIYESSSPSYMLMAGISDAIMYMEKYGGARLEELSKRIDKFTTKADGETKLIRVLTNDQNDAGIFDRDKSKIIITTKGVKVSGEWLLEELYKKYDIQLEMASEDYATALCSLMDTDEGFERLLNALVMIDKTLSPADKDDFFTNQNFVDLVYKKVKSEISIKQAMMSEREEVSLAEASKRVCGEYIYMYPPGIPILCPGEVISDELLSGLFLCKKNGFKLYGQADSPAERLLVCKLS